MEQTVPLETALQHFAAASIRGELAGRRKEREKIYELLKREGEYHALLLLKTEESKELVK